MKSIKMQFPERLRSATGASSEYVNDVYRPETANDPPLEEVSFIFHTISWTYPNDGITHEDSWGVTR